MMKNLLFTILLLLGIVTWVQAQTKVITGKVTTENTEPISGASVMLKGSNTGTQTDLNGNFRLAVPETATTLIVSYISYQTKEVRITGNTVNVTLQDEDRSLSEVVVVGYGTRA
ncbi:carboxypeptidase-like regulatory domain-containing protein, partial [Pedobacter sp.]|uniref:carboxypeptidase-like regulatory domain-containing protein n=1 Tax=Pedobacter sp. TaxID=1411316 RepID=UPI003D7FD87A